MADYQEMYLKMMRATEQALRILIKAQRECEELYLSAQDPKIIFLPGQEPPADDPQE